MNPDLPPVPTLNPALVDGHRQAHADLEMGLETAYPPVARLFMRFANRATVASIAHVRMTLRRRARPPLFPAPRSFLGPDDLARLSGCAAAYRHLDSRLAIVDMGLDEPPALLPETPYVLHALAEGRVDNPLETNPGMIRGGEFESPRLPIAPYPPPVRARCRELLHDAVDVACNSELPAVTRAGWMLFTAGEIHPFQDGNGRVARLLYLLITGEEMPRTVDWGVSEQVGYYSERFLASLAQHDPSEMVELVTHLSTLGARLMSQRLGLLGALVPEMSRRLGVEIEAAVLVVATWLRRTARGDELAVDLNLAYDAMLAQADEMVALGVLERRQQRLGALPTRPTYALSRAARAEFEKVVDPLE